MLQNTIINSSASINKFYHRLKIFNNNKNKTALLSFMSHNDRFRCLVF